MMDLIGGRVLCQSLPTPTATTFTSVISLPSTSLANHAMSSSRRSPGEAVPPTSAFSGLTSLSLQGDSRPTSYGLAVLLRVEPLTGTFAFLKYYSLLLDHSVSFYAS